MTSNASPNGPSWWGRLSEGSKIALIAAVIAGVLGIIGSIIGGLLSGGSSSGSTPTIASSSVAAPTEPSNGSAAGGSSSPSSGYITAYKNTQVIIQTIQGGICQEGENVNINKPSVDPVETGSDSFVLDSTNCVNWAFQVGLLNGAAGSKPAPSSQTQDSPAACLQAIASDPNPQNDNAQTGDAFCVESADDFITYVKIISVDPQGDVKLHLNGWGAS